MWCMWGMDVGVDGCGCVGVGGQTGHDNVITCSGCGWMWVWMDVCLCVSGWVGGMDMIMS